MWPEHGERMVSYVSIWAGEVTLTGPNSKTYTFDSRVWEVPDEERWPPEGAVLVAGPGAPWAPMGEEGA